MIFCYTYRQSLVQSSSKKLPPAEKGNTYRDPHLDIVVKETRRSWNADN